MALRWFTVFIQCSWRPQLRGWCPQSLAYRSEKAPRAKSRDLKAEQCKVASPTCASSSPKTLRSGQSLSPCFRQGVRLELADSLFRVIQKSGEDCLFIGDWNNTPEQPPAVGPLQNGSLHLADEVAGSSCINSPTRQDGRHIDYALHSFRLVPHSRSQHSGVADHDLVLYQFSMCEIEASRFVAPARNLLEVHQVSSETFLEHFPLQEFQDHLRNHDVQSAWNLLSNSAEHVLKPATGRPRCKIPSPTEPAKAPTKPDKLQSMTERKLRRTLRRVLENQRDVNAPWSLYRKICRDIHNLSRQFPELSEVSATDDAIATILQDCITKEQVHSQEARLQRWKHKMNEDEQALIRWVKGADDHINSSDDPSVPVHPQQKAEFYRNYWSGIWDPVESTNNADDIPSPSKTPYLRFSLFKVCFLKGFFLK